MSYNSYYLEEEEGPAGFPRRPGPVPFAFDSDDDMIDSDVRRSSEVESSDMSQSQSMSIEPEAPIPCRCRQCSYSKPPRPTLPRPFNITAYTRPTQYGPYISSVLTPKAEMEIDAVIRQADRIAHEIKYQCSTASEWWIRDLLFRPGFSESCPHNFREVFRSSDAWDKSSESFRVMPPTFTEKHMEEWLNTVADMLGVAFGKVTTSNEGKIIRPTCERSWSTQTTNSPQTGDIQSKKPGLSLLDRTLCSTDKGKMNRPGWAVIKAFAEVTQAAYDLASSSTVRNIVEKAYIMLATQPFRRFVIALAFFGQPETATGRWMLVLVDRSGVISSSPFTLNGSGGYALGQVLYCLSFANSHHIGIDETMTVCKLTGVVTHITVTGETPTSGSKMVKRIFEVDRLLHANPRISSCATRVWLVRRKGRYYVLKDSWPLKSEPFSEIRHLLTINQTIMEDTEMRDTLKHTYPVLIISQELGDCTELRRIELYDKPLPRVHRRIVTKAIGDPLTSFRSKFELCSIFCDVVACE